MKISTKNYFKLLLSTFFVVITTFSVGFAQSPGGVNSNIYVWYKSDLGITQGNGGVSEWADQAGTGLQFTQSIASRRPAYTPSSPLFNGYPSLDLDLVDDGMKNFAAIENVPYTFFVVYNSTSTSTAARRMIDGRENWLIGPYQNYGRYFGGAWVAGATALMNQRPVIATALGGAVAMDNQFYYHNGENLTSPSTGVTSAGYPGRINLGIEGSANQKAGGSIAELIAYHRVVTAVERNKIESYLAVKYGVSIDQTIKQDYTSSNNTVIWDKLFNAGFPNNIFGVGVDNGSGLNQTQSKSVNHNYLRISGSMGITDGSYLLLSDNGLSVGPKTQASLPGGAIAASPRIWTTSKTGTVGSIDITVNSSLSDVILLIDNNNDGVYETGMNPTATSGSDYTFAGVSLDHFAKVKIGYKTLPPGPGGVTMDMKLWLRADNASTTDGTLVNYWADESGNGIDLKQDNVSSQPSYVPSTMNENPVVNFSVKNMTNDLGITGTGTVNDINMFVVARVNDPSGTRNFLTQPVSGGNLQIFLPYNNTLYWRPRTPDVTTPFNAIPDTDKARLYGFYASTTSGQTYPGVKNVLTTNGGVLNSSNTFNGFTGLESVFNLGNTTLNTDVAELIAYTGPLDEVKNNKIQSYLAIKYGTNIDQTVPTDYTMSTGDTIWNAAENGAYSEFIFGIGHDTGGSLYQPSSENAYTDRARIEGASALPDGSFFILSDNDLPETPVAQGGLPGGNTFGTPLAWNVSKTGGVGTVDLTFTGELSGADLLVDNDNDGTYETAIPASAIALGPNGYAHSFTGLSLNHNAKLKLGYKCMEPLLSPNVVIQEVIVPTVTACHSTGAFVVRLKNIGLANITNLTFRDSMPPGMSYVPGTVSGAGVTFGDSLADNVVTFNVASIPSSDSVDITFEVRADCDISTTATDITNTYQAFWECSFSSPFETPFYPIIFPSLSITASNDISEVFCMSFVPRTIVINNGGFGSLDSVIVTDVQDQTSLVVTSFSHGEASGLGTTNAQTILRAVDFIALGVGPTLDQNETITIYDTLFVSGFTSPIQSDISVLWGCNGDLCPNGTTNNMTIINTVISSASEAPQLTRELYKISGSDSYDQIYNRTKKYKEVVRNTGNIIATNVQIHPIAMGLEYIVVDSVWAQLNDNPRYHPSMAHHSFGNPFHMKPNPAGMNHVTDPYPFPGFDQPSNARIILGDLLSGDSIVVTFEVNTAGPVITGNNFVGNFTSQNFCGWDYNNRDGLSIGRVHDARLFWQGCPGGSYQICAAAFPSELYNGRDPDPVSMPLELRISRFRGYSMIDSTNITTFEQCAYDNEDTVKVLLSAAVMDLPFMTDKSEFFIRIKTNGGVRWAGDYTFMRLTSWDGAAQWPADKVVDNSVMDSTILVYFKKSDLPPALATDWANNVYNTYQGAMELAIHFINECPGPPVKRIWMSRVYNIDTTNSEPPFETGAFDFQAGMEWNSLCPQFPCLDGVSILDYSQGRITFGEPDNNNDGLPDASGSLNQNRILKQRMTWSDTMEFNNKMVIHTTQPGGVPYMYVRSDILYANVAVSTTCNEFMAKAKPIITLRRPGVGVFTAEGNAVPIDSANTFLANISLQGPEGITIPGITAYQDGDTVELTQHMVYYEPHYGWTNVKFAILHVPYTSLVINPSDPEKFKCDSSICNFEVADMDLGASTTPFNQVSCANESGMQIFFRTQLRGTGCGNNLFPGESRSIMATTFYKLVVPPSSRWSIQNINAYYGRTLLGSCTSHLVNNQQVPPSLYYYSGDTLMLDLKAIGAYFGYDIMEDHNFYNYWYFNFDMKYTPDPNLQACVKDHTDIQTTFQGFRDHEILLPFNDTALQNVPANPIAYLNWPWVNNNTLNLFAGSNVTITSPDLVIPVRYTRGTSRVYGNNFIAIPTDGNIVIDSITSLTPTGTKLTKIGDGIWDVTNFGGSRDLYVHARIISCGGNSLTMYADRVPCSGFPDSWDSYACKQYANSTVFTFTTFDGELQMIDSLYTVQKDICTPDTLEFQVINSQTVDANAVKISFELPTGMVLIPGQTELKRGNGPWVPTFDPTDTLGVYSWTLPPGDTLKMFTPGDPAINKMYLRVTINTECGFISGSQITSSIAGRVGCGPITSLFNTNPPPMLINGAPTLSYFTNPTVTVEQVTGCVDGALFDYKTKMIISGSAVGAQDSIRVTLPKEYMFDSYVSTYNTPHNAPPLQPNVVTQPNGRQTLTWQTPPGTAPGDSIVYTFRYKERSTTENKCSIIEPRRTWINTFIYTSVYCETIMATCPVGISNGVDTAYMWSLKPSLNLVDTPSAHLEQGCDNEGSVSVLTLDGSILNNGSADVLSPTNIIMEAYIDINGSGTVDSGDVAFPPYLYGGGLEVDSTHMFSYEESVLVEDCADCAFKNVLVVFSNTPEAPVGSSQCLCDTLTVISITPTIGVAEKPDAGADQTVDCAALPGGSAGLNAIGIGSWMEQPGNPGGSTIANPANSITSVSDFTLPGEYRYIFVDSSGCQDTVMITVTAKPNAGPDQAVSCISSFPGGSATMAAVAGAPSVWTAMAGNPGMATITSESSPTTTITDFEVVGNYNFLWTDTATGCVDTALIIVSDKIDAGRDTTVNCVNLPGGSAQATAVGTGTWTAQPGNPGTASITSNADPMTTFTNFSASGTYNFIWSGTTCSDTMSVVVTEKPDAGADQAITCVSLPGGIATLTGSDPGVWEALASNPGPVTIATPNAAMTTVSDFTFGGDYLFQRRNGMCTDTVKVTVTIKPNAGPDQQGCALTLPGGMVTMQGVGIGTWSAMPGNPGTARIVFPNSQSTSIDSFSAPGTYYFILDNGTCSDTAAVVVSPKPVAGIDQTIECLTAFPGGSATMAGTAIAGGIWTAEVTNPGTATIVAPASATTDINTFSAAGEYTFYWTSGAGCTDTALVVVSAKPDAGADQMVTCAYPTGDTATMAATGQGMWTAMAGNPGSASITTPADSATTITGFTVAGTYNFIWTNAANCTDTAQVDVTVKPNAGVDKEETCVNFPGGSTTMTAVGTGTWSAMGGNPGSSAITSPMSPTTTITDYSTAGTYHFIWTNDDNCTDTVAVVVTGRSSAGPDQMIDCVPLPGGSVTMAAMGDGQWTENPSNPGTATITFAFVANTTITAFSDPGVYEFIWDDGTCTDTMQVTVTGKPDAGEDNTVDCVPNATGDSVTMSAIGIGTWSAMGGNPGSVTITTPDNSATSITGFSVAGVYNFIWTDTNSCTDTAQVSVTKKPDAGPDQMVMCFTNDTATMAAVVPGTWTVGAGSTGTAVIETPDDPGTKVHTFSAVGNYIMIFTDTAGCMDTAMIVTEDICMCLTPPLVSLIEDSVKICGTDIATVNYEVAYGPANLTLSPGAAGTLSTSMLPNDTSTFMYTPGMGDVGNVVTIYTTIPDPDGEGLCEESRDSVKIEVFSLVVTTDATLTECETSNEQGLFDLTSTKATVHSGGGVTFT